MGGMESSKLRIMRGGGGWKKKNINGWVRHNGRGVDLKMAGGCNPFQINFGATKDT